MSYYFGMPSLVEFSSIEENVELCSELGLNFVELNMDLPYCLPEANNVDRLNELRSKHNVNFTMHFPEEIDFATFMPTIRRANITLFEEICDFGKQIGVSKVNIHISKGVHFTLPDKKIKIYEVYKDRFIINLCSAIKELTVIAKQANIKLCVENTSMPSYIKEAFENIVTIDDVYFTWDIGHDAKDKYSAREFYNRHTDKIAHMHMHDVDEDKDHRTLFSGSVDIKEKLGFVKENNISTVIEIKTANDLRESVERLQNKI
ncbi:MAG TPA: hypothetical protein DEP72_06560 [Clostridiales bacterium]|nr:MAG: hypothetical protein A2Y18_03545 [Clostridiales bacterium GWD2_32_19]HCC07800.1 hypothetical protein [Clostridiales bacterium]